MNRPGLAKARRGACIRAGVLNRDAEMWIVRLLTRMSEGEADGSTFYGSTMFSVDLHALESHWRGPLDREALRIAVDGSVRLRIRFMRFASGDVRQRLPAETFGMATSETRVYLSRDSLQIDVDVEMALDVGTSEHQSGQGQ